MVGTSVSLLKLLARVRPEVWEVIGGHSEGARRGRLPVGPLPEPWIVSTQLGAFELAGRLMDAASLTQAQGGDGPGLLQRTLDDDGWGIEGRPIVVKLPPGWWKHYRPKPPRPNELDDLDLISPLVTAGIAFAMLSESIEDDALSSAARETGWKILDIATDSYDRL